MTAPRLSDDVLRFMQSIATEQVWLTVLGPGEAEMYDAIARVAGIEPLGKAWIKIERSDAQQMLASLLHRSLAYRAELMPAQRAAWLAGEFVSAFGVYGGRFATNGEASSWTPATRYTMDCGLVIINELGSGLSVSRARTDAHQSSPKILSPTHSPLRHPVHRVPEPAHHSMKLDGQKWRIQTSHVRLGNSVYRVVRPARAMLHAPLHTTSWNGAEICLDKPTAVELACAWWLAARSPRTLIHLPLRKSPRDCGTWAKRRRLDLLLLHHSLVFPPSRWKEVRARAKDWQPHTITLPTRPFREIKPDEIERTYWREHRDNLRSTIAAETLIITGSRPAFELEGDGIAKLAQEGPADIAAQPDVHVCTELDIAGIWHGLHFEICQTHR